MQKHSRRKAFLFWLLLGTVAVVASINIVNYFNDLVKERYSVDVFRDIYYAAETEMLPVVSPIPATVESLIPSPSAPPIASPTPIARLPKVPYPGQGQFVIPTEKFLKLKQKNQDIVGWLTIDGVVDQAVVQKDNEYYLNQDYLKKKNVNGALFMDMVVSLDTRPYTLIVYGHNMKTGEMFGKLLKYKEASWYKQHAFVTFNSEYEDGQYVIFAAGKMQAVPGSAYLDLYRLLTDEIDERESVIRQIKALSYFDSYIDVQADDQVLLLITCDGDSSERFFVSARRIRDYEEISTLNIDVLKSWQLR